MIKDKYPTALLFDFRKGSYVPKNGTVSSFTKGNGYWVNSGIGRGLKFDRLTTEVNLGNTNDFNYDDSTTFFAVFKTSGSTIQYLSSKTEAAATYKGWGWYLDTSGRVTFRIFYNGTGTGINVRTDASYNDGKIHYVVMTYDGSGTAAGVTFYVDGVAVIDVHVLDAGFGGDTLNSENWTLGDATYGSLTFGGTMFQLGQISNVLTGAEASQLYEELKQEAHYDRVDIKSTGIYRNILTDGNMEASGTDDWESVNTATLSKVTSGQQEGAQALRVTKSGGVGGAGQYIMQSGKEYRITGYARGDGTARAAIGSSTDYDFYWTGTVSATWEAFDVTVTGATGKPLLNLSKYTSGGDWVEFDDVKIFECNSDGTPKYPETYIADGKGWNESVANVTGGFLENTDWRVSTGTWTIEQSDGFDKEIENGGSGLLYRPTSQQYGTWEFDLYKGTTNTQPYVTFISDRVDANFQPLGYQLVVSSAETLFLRRVNAGGAISIVTGDAGVFPIGQWVSLKITRTTSGLWELFQDGVSVGTGTDNVYTTGPFCVLDFATTDAIRNFKFIPYIE